MLRAEAIDDLSFSAASSSNWALVAMILFSAGYALLTIVVLWRLAGRQRSTYDEFVAAGVYRESLDATPPPAPAAPAPAAPADPPPRARDAASREIRLAELARLADAGLISAEEAAERRRRILDDV